MTTYPRTTLGLAVAASFTAAAFSSANDFSELSLEDLASVPVVESAKKHGKLFDTPAGAFVFDAERIESLPADSIPELLRYAPGVHIMRANNGTWGMGIRGMNSRFLGRALLSVDDQSLYGSIFSGLFGSQHDLFIDDVASIEVVYGPGGSLWGPNSANGRVNVVLKSAFETEGNLFKAKVGTENVEIAARSGWSLSQKAAMRVSAKAGRRDDNGSPLFDDDWETLRLSAQLDTRPSTSDLLTVSGEYYDSDLSGAMRTADLETGSIGLSGGNEHQRGVNLQAKWTRQYDEDNGVTLRSWAGYTEMRAFYVDYNLSVFGFESRARKRLGERHRFIVTAGVTLENSDLKDGQNIVFQPGYENNNLSANAGTEYTFEVTPDVLELSLGLAANYSSYADRSTLLPSARILYSLNENSRIWASYSSSTRTVPAGMKDFETFVFGGRPIEPIIIPTPGGNVPIGTAITVGRVDDRINNEDLNAFELGYRQRLSPKTTLVANAFLYKYEDLFGPRDLRASPILTAANPYLLVETLTTNAADGESIGFELALQNEINKHLQASVSYAYIEDSFEPILNAALPLAAFPTLQNTISELDNNVPRQSLSATLLANFAADWQAHLGLRYTDGFRSPQRNQPSITQADLRISWQPDENLRLSVLGRNLLDSRTDEQGLKDLLGLTTEIQREVSLEIRYSF